MAGTGQFSSKNFMSPGPITTRGAPAAPDQSAAETARLQRQDATIPSAGAGHGLVNPEFVRPGTPYAHDTNNVVASGKTDDTDKINLSTAFSPNIMDFYDVVTYHWKFFMVDNNAATTGQIFNDSSQTIIAESGVSDLTIDKVEIHSIATPSVETGTGTSTTVKFEIVEPSGAGLIDKIFYQSLALGIGNWNVQPFYLQLQFRGRSPTTSAADDGTPGSIGSLRWVYPIKITSIKANVTTVGTRYEFDAIIYNEYAQGNTIFTLQTTLVLDGLTTFVSAMAKLQYQLNDDQIYKLIDNYSVPDSYRIVVDPIFTKDRYNITPADNNANASRSDSMSDSDNKTGTFAAGTGIDKIIDSLLSQTNGAQEDIKNSTVPAGDGNPMTVENSQMKKFWRIITETRPLKFDPRRNDYAREYTIYVVQYDIGVLDQATTQDSTPPLTLEAERKRLMTYVKKSILKKKYNYIFTGLNDQIINFDIKINNAFAVAMSRMGGIYFNAAMADKGKTYQDNAATEGDLTAKITKAISMQNTAASANTSEAQDSIAAAKAAIAASATTQEEKARLQNLLDHSKPESRLNFIQQSQQTGAITGTFNLAQQNQALALSRKNATANATPRDQKVSQANFNFISDVDIKSDAAQQAYSNYVSQIKGKLRPVARVDSLQQRQTGLGVGANSNSGIQKLSSMFSVALHSPYDASFASTILSIKGDPFWLFPQPYLSTNASTSLFKSKLADSDAIDLIKSAHTRTNGLVNDSVNLFGTDNFIIIRFRTPRLFNLDNNADSNNPNADVETFSGVFKVTTVVSKFENGKFHQDLSCLLDYNINILNFMSEIESNAMKTDINASPDDAVQTSTVPSTAVKTQKVMGLSNQVGVPDSFVTSLTPAQQVAKQAFSAKGVSLGSNIPTSVASLIPGLPNKLI